MLVPVAAGGSFWLRSLALAAPGALALLVPAPAAAAARSASPAMGCGRPVGGRSKRISSTWWPLLLFAATFLLLLLLLLPTVVDAAEQVILRWERDTQGNLLQPGQVIDDEFHTTEGISVTIKAESFAADGSNVRAIFPSSDPPEVDGDVVDPDLGSPNQFCDGGGPGVGEGGRPGEPGENCRALGNILIIPTVGDADNDGFIDAAPDDDARGGLAIFSFSQPVTIDYLEILDQELLETADIFLYSSREATPANLIAQFSAMALGDNSFQRLALNTGNVVRMEVEYEGSGGLAALAYTPGEPTAVSLAALSAASASNPSAPILITLLLLTGLTAVWVLLHRRRSDWGREKHLVTATEPRRHPRP